jgi:DnaJ-class molecular chaperone
MTARPPKFTVPCTDCSGSGIKPRFKPPEGSKEIDLSAFPMLCDRCNGSGVMPAPGPASE